TPAEAPLSENTDVAIIIPRRLRDPAHLKYVASLPCLICGRTPAHAHHLRFAQLRSLGSKPSDEWTVPLCPIHHRSLHDAGREEEWWQAKEIDAKAEAERLWTETHQPTEPSAPAAVTVSPLLEPESHEPTAPEPQEHAAPSSETKNVDVRSP
ncbi:MAG TPA: DUF968 domain-containing protein, partial [Stellaceae bacterium]|nr:DUF968 domain-containing protein [Stellaceae bacterium]